MTTHGFEAGQLVVSRYRLPSELQPWIHDIHIGEVVEPGDDPATWNGSNSERYYCEIAGLVPVLYCARFPCFYCRETQHEGFRAHDGADSLIRVTPKEAALSFPAKVLRFIGIEALRNLARSKHPGAAELLAEQEERAQT